MRRFPAESGKCAALARAVLLVAKPLDSEACGLQVVPKNSAVYILPKHPRIRCWYAHTLIRAVSHHVDALTGVEGCAKETYLEDHWNYPDALEIRPVDVATIDPGIQNVDAQG